MDELERVKRLYTLEQEELSYGRRFIGGVDEAGRGPLAGPVVAGVVVLPVLSTDEDFLYWKQIDDSKKLSPKLREQIYNLLFQHPDVYIGIGIVSEVIIDRENILNATRLAVRKALGNLGIKPDVLLIDGMIVPGIGIPQRKIVDGDERSLSIAAASIVAKVTRDNIMLEYHKIYPEYGFDRHKGYGTKEHFQRLRMFGPCKIHRKSFRPISLMREIGM